MSHHDYASTTSHESGESSTRSPSRSSTSSKTSTSSVVTHANISTDNWARKFMKYTTGVPPSKPLTLRKTQVITTEETYDHDEAAMVYMDSYYFTYAWVTPSFDDGVSTVDSRSSGRNRRRRRKGRPESRGFDPASQPPPPPGAGFVPSPHHAGPYMTPGVLDEMDYMAMADGMCPDFGFMGHPDIPPPPPPGPGRPTTAFAHSHN
ncbi:hypothetical protein ACRALDRAFT_2034899 [Sodiomyces alcalophilus JCM 7366]|uniref:uncharacterized protein n=1 Tax=Sodiomyces alcalophilus JCM 7366 TaxID=591952 RepID=UPI0039B4A562